MLVFKKEEKEQGPDEDEKGQGGQEGIIYSCCWKKRSVLHAYSDA